jgi:hypothetical protein
MNVRLFAARGDVRLFAIAGDALYFSTRPGGELDRASEALLRGESPESALPGAERVPLARVRCAVAPLTGRTMDLEWESGRRRLCFHDRKSRDAAFEAVEASLPAVRRSRERIPRSAAVVLPALAAVFFAADAWRCGPASWRGLVDGAGFALALLWLGAWACRPPERMKLVAGTSIQEF